MFNCSDIKSAFRFAVMNSVVAFTFKAIIDARAHYINNKKFNRAKVIQNKQLSNLVLDNSNLIWETSHDPEKEIFSFSTHEVNDDEKLLLYKGWSFSIPPKLLDYTDHMLPF